MATLTDSGRSLLAAHLQKQPLYLGWGLGSESMPAESREALGLIHPMGLRLFDTVAFCVADKKGDWVTPQGNFTPSELPTATLYLSCRFDFSDAVGEVIQEIGVFVGSEMVPDLPLGQRYFNRDQVHSFGTLLLIEHLTPLKRLSTTRELFNFVLQF